MIVRSLQQEVAIRGDAASEYDIKIPVVAEGPAGKINMDCIWVEELDPLVAGGGDGSSPSDFIDEQIL